MQEVWIEFLRSAAGALGQALRRDAGLRNALRDAAQALVRRLDELGEDSVQATLEPPTAPPPTADAHESHPASASALPVATAPVTPLRDMPLTLGDATVTVSARGAEPSASTAPPMSFAPAVVAYPKRAPFDLRTTMRRCRLKTEACRWAGERRRALREGVDEEEIRRRDEDILSRSEAIQPCYLWMMHTRVFTLPDDAVLEDIAGSFEALAAAIELVLLIEGTEDSSAPSDAYSDGLRLLAEGQSAVRVACLLVDRSLKDREQDDVFLWLRDQTQLRVIERHMRLDDPADPSGWVRLAERIAELRSAVHGRQSSRDQRRSLLNRARYHAKRVVAADDADAARADWTRIADAVEGLVGDGVPPSDREIRDILLPLIDDLPELDFGAGMNAVLDQIDRFVEQLEHEPEYVSVRGPSQSLLHARELLRGRSMVLVGGQPRELQRRKIEQAFELAELRWLAVRHHQSLEAEALPFLNRSEFSVFVAMTRFRSHLFGPQLREWCKQTGKVYVELPGGYGVEQIAHQVLSQASEVLGSTVASGDHG